MNKNTLDFIKHLTKLDTKTLSQKALKLADECGDVAKNILPYEQAHGTLHKFVHKDMIVEDCVDVMLVALSIAYSLGYNDQDITDLMDKKSKYWATLQDNEKGVDADNLPHEIHVTVSNVVDIEYFKYACEQMRVKPIVLALQMQNNEKYKDVMTSSVFIGSTADAYDEVKRIESDLNYYNYTPIRSKIEVPPFHPCVPTNANGLQHLKDRYFESHIAVLLDTTCTVGPTFGSLYNIVNTTSLHASQNVFKIDGDISTIMLTYRKYSGSLEEFKNKVESYRKLLIDNGFSLSSKSIIEYAVYDTNTSHDKLWINKRIIDKINTLHGVVA